MSIWTAPVATRSPINCVIRRLILLTLMAGVTSAPGEDIEAAASPFNPRDLDHLAFFVESVRGMQIATSSSMESLRRQGELTPLEECWADRDRFPHGTIRRWEDQSSYSHPTPRNPEVKGGRDFGQDDPDRPGFIPDGCNGRPCARGGPARERPGNHLQPCYFETDWKQGFATKGPFSVFILARPVSQQEDFVYYGNHGSGTLRHLVADDALEFMVSSKRVRLTGPRAVEIGTWQIIEVHRDERNRFETVVNGSRVTLPGASLEGEFAFRYLFNDCKGSGEEMHGDIAACIIYTSSLNADQKLRVRGYLESVYDLGKPRSSSPGSGILARAMSEGSRGYRARPCGLDANRNGVLGEHEDRGLGDSASLDPDGDGVEEDILHVCSERGDDLEGDGSPEKPFRTISEALRHCDGPEDGAEDIVRISGTFHETATLPHGGVPGQYTAAGFAFPRNPLLLVGWDRDGDGVYPPYDLDDTAVLDGKKRLAWAIRTNRKISHVEIAHLTIRDYGFQEDNAGAIQLFHWGDGEQSHVYIHDVEFVGINRGEKDASAKIVLNFWGGPMTDVAVINNLVEGYSSYFCRGAPPDGAGRFRFERNTLRMQGTRGASFVTGWKLWGHHRVVEILDNVIDANASAWQPEGHISGIGVCQGTQDWTIRGNLLIDTGIRLQPYADGFPFERPLDRVRIERNLFWSGYRGWTWPRLAIHIQADRRAPAHQSVKDVTITDNVVTGTAGWGAAILCNASNASGPQPGAVTIADNTLVGPFDRSRAAICVETSRFGPYHQQSFEIRRNRIANVGEGRNISFDYAPEGLYADRNLYDPRAGFRWNSPHQYDTMSFDAWRAATGQDGRSRLAAQPWDGEKVRGRQKTLPADPDSEN